MSVIDKVTEVLFEKFKDKTDRGGNPYIEHLFRVAEESEAICVGSYLTGLLHDAIEDTDLTSDDLYLLGVRRKVINRVSVLTKGEDENYRIYINRIKKYAKRHTDLNILAVKISDLNDNLNLSRLKSFNEGDLGRVQRYFAARNGLIEVFDGINRKVL